jgi:diguanylate cyclase (GGDEF)-like protein
MTIHDWLLRRLSAASGRSPRPSGGDGDADPASRATTTVTHDRSLARRIDEELGSVVQPHTVCRNAWTASIALRRRPTELLLLDWRLPSRQLGLLLDVAGRPDAGGPPIPVLALLPQDRARELVADVAGRSDEHVVLPLDPAILRARVAMLDRRRRDLDRLRATGDDVRQQLERLRLASDAEGDVVWEWEPDADRLETSSEWATWTGSASSNPSHPLSEWLRRVHPDDADRLRDLLHSAAADGASPFEHRFRLRHADGEWRWTLARGHTVTVGPDARRRVVGLQTDLTQRDPYLTTPTSRAIQDPLTSLPTRSLLLDRLEHAFLKARREQTKGFAVLFFDVDRFKNINDSLGHLKGDRLLRQIADRVRSSCRPSDTVARFGGDEFVVVVEDLPDVRSATVAADRLLKAFRVPFDLDGVEVFVSISIGIAYWNRDYTTPENMLRDADTAMYRAKSSGRNRFSVFDEAMHAQVVATLQLENDLRRALSRSEFRAYYQPILSLAEGRIVGFEVLARWEHPERGLLLPASFIPVAEEMGAIIQLDRAMIEQGADRLRAWQRSHRRTPPLYLSVNVSSTQFNQTDLVTHIDLALRKAGLYGRSLTIEVTESVLMENAAYAQDMLQQLRSLDIGISIDDFGTGYSSLAYLRRFGIDTLKIDHSFVSRMLQDEDSSEIVRTITTLARNLGKQTVAEGVETRSQLEVLREIGIDHVQGNFISPPLTGERATELLARTWTSDNQLAKILDDRRSGVAVSGD